MCDIILASPGSTAEQLMLFGKNSDRQRNEAQAVEYFPRADHGPNATLDCTYMTIPQAPRTHAVMLCRPFWIWGAEMGANEHGVVIGNEGLHARIAAPEQKALTGMDLLRLALERSTTAAEALDVITLLLERYGQGGNCGHLTPAYYNNGFLIADATQAFVLETVGREWVVERVSGLRSMSNRYSIEREVHSSSTGMNALIRDLDSSATAETNFASAIANPDREHIGNAAARRACSTALLNSRDGQLSVSDMMRILRDHGSGDRHHPEWRAECATVRTLCMHAGAADRAGQTVGAMVSELHADRSVHWVTGTAATCISIFKPVMVGSTPVPAHGPPLSDRFDPSTLWWSHERLHRAALLGDFARFLDDIQAERDALEADFRARMRAVLEAGSIAECSRVVAKCWSDAFTMEEGWRSRIDADIATSSRVQSPYVRGWTDMNRLAGMEENNGSTHEI